MMIITMNENAYYITELFLKTIEIIALYSVGVLVSLLILAMFDE